MICTWTTLPPANLQSPWPPNGRTFWPSQNHWLDLLLVSLAQTYSDGQTVHLILHSMCMLQGKLTQTIWLPQTTANSPTPMGIHFYGFHWTTSDIGGTHCDISNSWPPNQTIPFHSYPWLHRLPGTCPAVPYPCILKTWYAIPCHLQLGLWVHLSLLLIPW